MIEGIFTAGYDVLVLEGLGQGNVTPAIAKAIKNYQHTIIPVVLVSRCFNGIAEGVYGYEGDGKELEDAGVIFADGINNQKARLKLLIGMKQIHTLIDLKLFFIQHVLTSLFILKQAIST